MNRLFRHSSRDSLMVVITFCQLILTGWLAATWESRAPLYNLLFLPLCLFLFWYNALVATHNFVHTPCFESKFLNRLYAIVNSANMLTPVLHYRYIHFNHHQYGNDRKDVQGRTQDLSSTFAHSRDDESENALSYSTFSLLRDDFAASFRQAKAQGEIVQMGLEFGSCILAAVVYLLLSWKFFLYFQLPVFYVGWCLTYLSNYYEHFGATPESRYANSTSYYGRIYNLLFCNEGYHQEHHLRPQIHWTQRSSIYDAFQDDLDRVDRIVLNYPHVLGFLHFWRNDRVSSKIAIDKN
jgi:fatty acid desaturase